MEKKTMTGEGLFIKPCTTKHTDKAAAMSLSDAVSEKKKKKKKKKKTRTSGEGLFIKPCKTKLPDKAAAISISETVSEKKKKKKRKRKMKKTGEALFIKPCTTKLSETVSKSSKKKRRLTPQKLVEGDEEEEEEEEEEIAKIEFEQGNHVDVEVLLSSKARNFLVTSKGGEEVPIAVLARKYVIVCCFYVSLDADDTFFPTCKSIEALYNELTLKQIAHQVKFVVVLKNDPGFGQAEFDAFFSRLSVNCLAIPFADSKSRDKICKSFGLSADGVYKYESPSLVVHPNGKVLQFDLDLLYEYGARSFPFTKEHIDDIERQDDVVRDRLRYTESPIFLEELLQCDYLSRIGSENDYIPTSALNDTVVAIYLCCTGQRMEMLQDLHQQCFDKGFKFEVILVPLSFTRPYEIPSFHDRIKQDALKHPRSSSWWTFPYDDKVYRNLWRLLFIDYEDDLLFLPNGRCPGDLSGKEIALYYGISAYPFTRNTLINNEVSKLRSFTLKDLLGNTGMWPLLENKNVLLYFDSPGCDLDSGRLFKILKRDYHKIKAKYTDSEVVFVTVHTTRQMKKSRISEMEWPILPLELCESVTIRFGSLTYPSLVAFGRDGKILSITADFRLPVSTSSESPFDDTLSSDLEFGLPSQ